MQSMASPSNSDCQALAACPAPSTSIVDVSIVIPCHNAASTISETFDSLLSQTLAGHKQELVLFNDASSDNTLEVIFSYIQRFLGNGTQVSVIPTAEKECISFQPLNNNEEQFLKLQSEIASKDIATARGPAFGRNAGVRVSKGTVIAMCDADDISLPERLESQLPLALSNPDAIVGTQWTRLPEDSTPRYREWCNSLTPQQLISQQYRELTLIQPTWMYHRAVFDRISGYKPGSIDDLQFFYDHLRAGGRLLRVDKELVVYRFSLAGVSSQMHRLRILDVRIQNLENALLHKWESFTIWGAGRDGTELFNRLSEENRKKVVAFCDVSVKKIGTKYHNSRLHVSIPIIHFSEARSPCVLCVKPLLTGGQFEENLASKGWEEGVDYVQFA